MDIDLAACLRELDAAAEAGIVARHGRGPTAHRFSHAVIRETLLEEQATLDRLHQHRRIAAAMREIHAHNQEEVLSELAHHYCEASALGDVEAAIDYATRAAVRCSRIYAIEDAIGLYDEALNVLSANGLDADPRLARIYLDQGRLYEGLGRFGEALQCHTEGLGIAREQNQPDLFAELATALVFIFSDTAPSHAVPLLEEALRSLPEDGDQHALVKAHLAFASRSTRDRSRVAGLSTEAIELARELKDPAVLSRVLQLAVMGLRGFPEALDQRLEYGREMAALEAGREPTQDGLHSLYFHLLNCVEAGAMEEFEVLYRRYANDVGVGRMPHHEYYVMNLDIMLRLMRGEWQGLEERIEKALAHAEKLWRGAEGVYGVQMFALNRELGRLPGLAPLLERMAGNQEPNVWPPGYMLMCCEAGLDDSARRAFDAMAESNFSTLAADDLWLASTVFCAETCVHLGDADRAPVLYQLLRPYAEQVASHPNGICFGAVATYLGMLAALNGDREAACAHYESAIETNRRLHAWPALARTQVYFSRALLDSEVAEDRAAGRKLLGEAEQLAERFALAGLTATIARLSDAQSDALPDDLSPREVEVLKLIAIGRSNKDIARVLSISLSTVATHVRSILSKTGCANRTEAAAYAMREELA
jgi:DNA-binding CsgD family transcriptional regulator